MERSALAVEKSEAADAVTRTIPPKRAGRARPLHVVHIISGDLWAGAEVQVFNLACALQQDPDIRLFIVLFNEGLLAERLRQQGVEVRVLDETRMSSAAMLRATARLLGEWRADIVHTHRAKENVIGSLAARLAGAYSIRTVHGRNEHRPPSAWELRRQLALSVDRVCARYLQDRLIAVSGELGAHLCASVPREKVLVIENGIDFERLRREAKRPVELPGRNGSIKIALVGRLVPVKRVDIFLSMAQRLVQRLPSVFDFYLIGDGPLYEQTHAEVARLGLSDDVFLLGFRDPAAPYLARMDMLFITSDHEGLPMNLLESLGLQVPVVSRAVGGIPRVLDGGRCGTLVYGNDPRAFAAVAEQYASNPVGFRDKARQGAESCARYSAAVGKAAHVDLYRALVDVNESPGH